jgi:hypothetical protein
MPQIMSGRITKSEERKTKNEKTKRRIDQCADHQGCTANPTHPPRNDPSWLKEKGAKRTSASPSRRAMKELPALGEQA